jgi:Hsp20/alpha crystallin family
VALKRAALLKCFFSKCAIKTSITGAGRRIHQRPVNKLNHACAHPTPVKRHIRRLFESAEGAEVLCTGFRLEDFSLLVWRQREQFPLQAGYHSAPPTRSSRPGTRSRLRLRERISGEFDRTLSLPVQLDADRIKAEYRDGILALLLPRTERDKPRMIKIG